MSHVQRVRVLYKTCLKLHRGLPPQMQVIGDAYVKDEFRRHKSATTVQTGAFMEAWAVNQTLILKNLGEKLFSKIQFVAEICIDYISTNRGQRSPKRCDDR